ADHPAPPGEYGDDGAAPENEDHRVDQKYPDIKILRQRQQQGEDVDHRQLPLGVQANEYQGKQQKTCAEQMKGPAFPADAVLPDKHAGKHDQREAEQTDLPPACLPHAQPDRHRLGRLDWLQNIEQLRIKRKIAGKAGVVFHQMVALQLGNQPQLRTLRRVEGGMGLDTEYIRLSLFNGRVEYIQYRAVIEVHVVQFDGMLVLHQHDPVGRRGRYEILGHVRVCPGRHHQHGLLTRLEFLTEPLEACLSQQIAADDWRIQVGEMHVGEGRLIQVQLRIAIEFMPDGGLNFLLRQRPALNQPALKQLAPFKRFVDVHLRGGQWAAGEVFQQLACDRQCRQQNRLVENDHRHRGLADVINARDRFALGGALPSTNDDRLADGLLAVLVDEVQQRSLA